MGRGALFAGSGKSASITKVLPAMDSVPIVAGGGSGNVLLFMTVIDTGQGMGAGSLCTISAMTWSWCISKSFSDPAGWFLFGACNGSCVGTSVWQQRYLTAFQPCSAVYLV